MRYIFLFIFIVMLSSSVIAGNSYELKTSCVGNLLLQVNAVTGNTNYTINGCASGEKYYTCNCNSSVVFSNAVGEFTQISVRLQYYISKITNDTVLDEQAKRVETKVIDLKANPKEDISIMGEVIDVSSFLIGGLIIMLLFVVLLSVIVVILYMNVGKMKRKLGIGEDENVSLWDMSVYMFSKKDRKKEKEDERIRQEIEIKKLMRNL